MDGWMDGWMDGTGMLYHGAVVYTINGYHVYLLWSSKVHHRIPCYYHCNQWHMSKKHVFTMVIMA